MNYIKIREYIDSHGYVPNQTVVMTDEKLFMAYNPYLGFNAFTSNYANPLGEFSSRNEQIEAWGRDSWNQTPQQFIKSSTPRAGVGQMLSSSAAASRNQATATRSTWLKTSIRTSRMCVTARSSLTLTYSKRAGTPSRLARLWWRCVLIK